MNLKKLSAFVSGASLVMVTATAAVANQRVTDVVVYDHNKSVLSATPELYVECYDAEVPIYGTTTKQGDAAGSALAGMIIGGILGKGVSGNDKGAAMGAIMGGVIGADKGSKPKQQQVVTGYRIERVCEELTKTNKVWIDEYSHSTIRFYLDGKRYVLHFQK